MCSKCYDGGSWPDHRERNAYNPEDEEDPRYVHHPRKKKSKAPKPNRRGCHANDYGPHVYAIVEIRYWRQRYMMRNGELSPWKEGRRWIRRCVGCGKDKKTYYDWGGSSPVGRMFNESDIYQVIQYDKGTIYPWYY